MSLRVGVREILVQDMFQSVPHLNPRAHSPESIAYFSWTGVTVAGRRNATPPATAIDQNCVHLPPDVLSFNSDCG